MTDRREEVACVCRSVTRGAVEDAARPAIDAGGGTIAEIARATEATVGPCGGNRCVPGIVSLIASVRGTLAAGVDLAGAGSWLLRPGHAVAAHDEDSAPAETRPVPAATEIAVVGAGLAGIAAALAILDHGLRPLVLEHRSAIGGALRAEDPGVLSEDERLALARFRAARLTDAVELRPSTTVLGVEAADSTWRLVVTSAHGSASIESRAVILATGGYMAPSPLASGSRAGVMTVDLVHEALDLGFLPARRALLIGSGRIVDAALARMEAVGIDVTHLPGDEDRVIDEVRGDGRVTGVRIGDDWHDVDALVIADRLLADTMLPDRLDLPGCTKGEPLVVDETGETGLPGLFAAGTCASPDLDHAWSLASGMRVGAAAAEAVWERT